MAGHSKWAQIKRQKGVADSRRGQLFTKLGREVTIAARQGGGDPELNPALRLAIERARAANMPKDTIERAIKRGTGEEAGAAQLEEVTYEGYGPGGIAILVRALTDNRNRTASEVRSAFAKAGGNLGETGSVAWQFETKGIITITAAGVDPEEVALLAIDNGADDVKVDDGTVEVYTAPERLHALRKTLSEANIPVESAEVAQIPKTTVALDASHAAQVLRLLDKLDELDDVQHVASNADFPEEVLAAYA